MDTKVLHRYVGYLEGNLKLPSRPDYGTWYSVLNALKEVARLLESKGSEGEVQKSGCISPDSEVPYNPVEESKVAEPKRVNIPMVTLPMEVWRETVKRAEGNDINITRLHKTLSEECRLLSERCNELSRKRAMEREDFEIIIMDLKRDKEELKRHHALERKRLEESETVLRSALDATEKLRDEEGREFHADKRRMDYLDRTTCFHTREMIDKAIRDGEE